MKKVYYYTESEKEDILFQAKQNNWTLKEDAITIHGNYLVLGTRTDENVSQLENALMEMSTLSALQQAHNEQAILELTMIIGGV